MLGMILFLAILLFTCLPCECPRAKRPHSSARAGVTENSRRLKDQYEQEIGARVDTQGDPKAAAHGNEKEIYLRGSSDSGQD